jgi:hypothetical protein
MTPAQLEAFQRTHRNHLGLPLRVDGVQGPQTEFALDFETLCAGRRQIIVVAWNYLGLEEEPPGSNDEPSGTIRAWLERCGARRGDPWCAAFVSHCLSAALPEPVRIAGAQRLGKSLPATSQPFTADVFWYPTPSPPGSGHTGLVLGVSATEVMTLEGNQRHAVRCLRRPRAELRFARVPLGTEGTCPGVVPSVPAADGSTR